jgi:3-hydroxybutyryl-CoA dehydrogenase
MEGIYDQFYQDPRYRPSIITRQRYEAGILGRKTGRGFYAYENGKKVETAGAVATSPGVLPRTVRILDDGANGYLRGIATAAGCEIVDDPHAELTLVGLLGEDATGATRRLGANAQSTLGVDIVFGLDRHRTLVASPATSDAARMAALALLRHDGTRATLVDDSCGAVCQRVVAMIVNIASEIVEQRIASADDVDQAVKLGLGYPKGPLEWGDAIGPLTVVTILDTIYDRTRDPRYRASLWLRRRAELGLPLTPTN